jgi:hypothetical protein
MRTDPISKPNNKMRFSECQFLPSISLWSCVQPAELPRTSRPRHLLTNPVVLLAFAALSHHQLTRILSRDPQSK